MAGFPGVQMSAAGVSSPVFIDMTSQPYFQTTPCYQLGLVVTVTSGASLTYTVEVTADPTPTANGHWNEHDVLVSQTDSANSNIAFPVTGIRLNVTAYTSGSVNLGVAKWP